MNQEQWEAVDQYIEELFVPADDALDLALAESAAAGLPQIAVSPIYGKLLTLLARSMDARTILEIGTLGGYSTICLARALPEGGRLVTLEFNSLHAQVAQANIARAGLAGQVEVIVGRAVGSPDESVAVTTLGDLDPQQVDMRCLLIIGSSRTEVTERSGGRIVHTPRRY